MEVSLYPNLVRSLVCHTNPEVFSHLLNLEWFLIRLPSRELQQYRGTWNLIHGFAGYLYNKLLLCLDSRGSGLQHITMDRGVTSARSTKLG